MQSSEPGFNNMNDLAAFLHLIGNPLRLEILFCLLEKPCCVCELVEILKQRQPCVSQHLMLLRQAGLVRVKQEGWKHVYFISSEKLKVCLVYMHTNWLSTPAALISSGIQNND